MLNGRKCAFFMSIYAHVGHERPQMSGDAIVRHGRYLYMFVHILFNGRRTHVSQLRYLSYAYERFMRENPSPIFFLLIAPIDLDRNLFILNVDIALTKNTNNKDL